ncbi:MAG: SCO family protein [candidate division Zixibacteria bacterium HGW-Zixibacteria-1]|nr:MAG: SCO family protein [candidate division Zixibacteria bacterium HGW-Zixibacteria-1]
MKNYSNFRTAPKAVIVLLIIMVLFSVSPGQVIEENPKKLKGIGVNEHPGNQIPLDLTFTADDGREVKLAEYFNQGKPVILIMGYYTCPMLCNLVFNGVRDVVKEMDWVPGKQFQILTVSIDSTETPVLAAAKKKNYIESIDKAGVENGWVFFTGPAQRSRALADAIGFEYYYDEDNKQYAHAAVITILTPDGKISRYFYGIQFKELDVRLALMEAAEGKVGNTIDRLILYCYHYDPSAGSYTIFAANIMKLGGLATLVLLGALIFFLWLKGSRKKTRTV